MHATDHASKAPTAKRKHTAALVLGAFVFAVLPLRARSHASPDALHTLRVCADPNNLPFSNERGQGFENAIAQRLARTLGARVSYTYFPQRRGFFRQTLNAGRCDLVAGVPVDFELVETTRPYYRSTYAFVTRRAAATRFTSFDDERLRRVRIGVHVIGDDYNSLPPAQLLARRGIVENVRGYSIYGDYSKPDPPRALIDAVAGAQVDVAIAWGPLAGYFATREPVALDVVPIREEVDPVARMHFDIAMGVRRGEHALRERIDAALQRNHADIAKILADYHVPLLPESPSR